MIEGKKIRLRPIKKEDIDKWLIWLNDLEITRNLNSNMVSGVSREGEEEFYNTMQKSQSDLVFSIESKTGDQAGLAGLHRIDQIWRNGEFGILIGEKQFQSRGFGTEATYLLVKYAFDTLNLNRIELSVNSDNIRGIKCYERVGFRHEGIRRNHVYRDGEYRDMILMGILRGELNHCCQ